jgi:hypothetical protein
MGPKGYAIKSNGNATKELSWMDRMCHKIETYCDLGEPGRGPSIIQEIEEQFNTFGAGLRKFANEANDFVQVLLNVPLTPNEGIGEKMVDLPKQRDLKAVQGEEQVAKQPVNQPGAAPMNFFDEACMKMTKKGELKDVRDTDYNNCRALNVLPVDDGDKFPFAEVAWDWPQQPYNQSIEAYIEPQRYHEVGQASCGSLDLSDSEMDAFVKEEAVADVGENVKNSNEMERENQSAMTCLPIDDAWNSQRDATSDSTLLDGWEGDDIVINEDEDENEEEDDDWEIV